jgi:chromosomal replication initiation ATPase DnaA
MSDKKYRKSMVESKQMALELPVANFITRDDIIEGAANSIALEMIDGWPQWPGLVVVLAGPVGSGKTHITKVWANKANARVISMDELSRLGDDRANDRPLLLEDARPNNINETELFHILNAKRAANASIIITSRSWPNEWDIKLADLSSRLRAAQLAEIGEPDDELLRKVLYKLFGDRQLPIEPNVIDYMVVRMERSLEAACQIVARLDTKGLAQKRKITRQLAGEVLSGIESGHFD